MELSDVILNCWHRLGFYLAVKFISSEADKHEEALI